MSVALLSPACFELFPTETWDFFDDPPPPIYQVFPLFSLESFPNSNVEERDRRRATFGQDSDLYCDSWDLPPTIMTDKDSDNPVTDNEEPEVI